MRPEVTGARRIVVKVGSSSLTTAAGGIDPDRMSRLVDALAATRQRGTDVVLVSSGAIAAGLAPLGFKRRPADLASQQAAASVGQGLLVHRYTEEFARHGLLASQVLLTVEDVTRRNNYRNARQTFAKLLELGVLPVVNENDTVATSEIRFGDNDRLAALVAHLVQADLLILLSDVDALYDAPPSQPGASRISEVRSAADLAGITIGSVGEAGVGTGGMVTKIDAARIAVEAGIPVVLTSAPQAAEALSGSDVGTLFHATGKRVGVRQLWLAHATEPAGRVAVDAGAVNALVNGGASLLAVGVTGATGSFLAGDPVDVVGPDGALVARGLIAFDADEVPALAGRCTDELDADHARELIHRDDLVVLAPR